MYKDISYIIQNELSTYSPGELQPTSIEIIISNKSTINFIKS